MKLLKKCAIVAVLMTLPWWLLPELRAATQAKLTISAVITTSCKLIVQLINNTPVASNSCNNSSGQQRDERPVITNNSTTDPGVTVSY